MKKYFYGLRPLLAIRYIEQGYGMPPVEFERLVEAVAPPEIHPGIVRLLALKKQTGELGLGAPDPDIGTYIESELLRHQDAFSGQGRPELIDNNHQRDKLNEIFRAAIL